MKWVMKALIAQRAVRLKTLPAERMFSWNVCRRNYSSSVTLRKAIPEVMAYHLNTCIGFISFRKFTWNTILWVRSGCVVSGPVGPGSASAMHSFLHRLLPNIFLSCLTSFYETMTYYFTLLLCLSLFLPLPPIDLPRIHYLQSPQW